MDTEAAGAGNIKIRRIVYLAAATLTLLILGLIYAWSIFAAPIGKEFGDYKAVLGQVFQVSMFAFCVSALFGAQLIKRTSARLAIIVAAVLLAAGFILSTLTVGFGVWTLFIFYGLLSGSGCGIAYNAIISLINPWFPDRVGLASGIMLMGFGVSSLVFGSLANMMFGFFDWRIIFIVIALIGALVLVALALLTKPAPTGLAQALGLPMTATVAETSPTKAQPILRTRAFWLFSLWATCALTGGLTVIGRAAQGAEILGADTAVFIGFGALLVGLISSMNGIGRVVNGAIFDRAGLVIVMVIAAIVSLVCTISLALAFSGTVDGGTWKPMLPVIYTFIYIGAAILIAFSYSAVPVMASVFTRQRYKPAEFAKNLGIANLNIASAASVNIIIAAVLGPIGDADPVLSQAPVNDSTVFIILAVLSVTSLVGALLFSKTYKKDLAAIADEL
ncbi:MAG: MFS transporter [Actinomycetia bacterium]|nr:MFS transporter [Actinomycetes bacterium]